MLKTVANVLHFFADTISPGKEKTPKVPFAEISGNTARSQPVVVPAPAEKFSEVTSEIVSAEKSFDEWNELFRKAEADSPLEHFAAGKAIETAETPESLADLLSLNEISDVSELKETALERLRGMEASFDEWKSLRESYEDETKSIATGKMIAAIESVDQLRDAADSVDGDEEDEEKLTVRLQTLSLDKDDLEEILNDYGSDNFLFIAVVEKFLEAAETVSPCLKLYFGWDFEDEENDKVLKKIFSLATPGECAIIAILAEEESILREWAEQRI